MNHWFNVDSSYRSEPKISMPFLPLLGKVNLSPQLKLVEGHGNCSCNGFQHRLMHKMANRKQGSDLIGTLKGLLTYHIDVIGLGKERGRVEAIIRVDGHCSEGCRVAVMYITHNWEESRKCKARIECSGSIGRCCWCEICEVKPALTEGAIDAANFSY